ncbi:poly(beta-D-mannuronate) lyase [Stenotrophomonas sp. ESTM1D_MKCIP4_1]|uniref:polysaccharide lyase 6 family protein n=1 Tax=Stenotrophomonas sp. ESTM1D_MKCIP4_1 TaxID=2072414 RepID=UPI000D53EE9E|nr:polysaccharide lyase 6 family protein [Stenotrophomonas sp. ESTM1D_MKCIP4_1]AWH54357.1 poly(beta-D-mannuronate) lyase [Stenotrophomonas sp. ESTM1D_MKCIP4_1]
MRIESPSHRPSNLFPASALAIGLSLCLTTSSTMAASWLVHDAAEFATAAAALQPGDEIVLADGTWTDTRLLLKGQGTAAAPITLRAQTPGKVILSGRSDLRLAGSHLQVSNLVFRDGYTPGDAVVAFRESSKAVASHSRVTGLVIDDYTNPDAGDQDYWVSLYGSHNRLDHSQLRGKTNAGPTVVVVRDATQGLDNQHRIDHNWFGPRPLLGVNGGETIRVGTSDTSLSDSNSTVENNWFEGCDGETEIVSNKSGGNTYRGNVFYRSAGALTLRHGNGNRVIDNVFLGDDKAGTGGVRIINADQTVSNNYFERLAGSSNRSALAIMDAQANPPLSGYAPVVNATVSRNTFVDVAKISFGVGHDPAKGIDVAASNSRFSANLIVNRNSRNPPTAASSLVGIAFSGNVQSPQASTVFPSGVESRSVTLQQAASGLWTPTPALPATGADAALAMTAREATGVDWYPKVGEVFLSRTSTGVDR